VTDVLACLFLAAVWTALAWLHGYGTGWEAMRTRAVGALRYSAALSRANGFATSDRALAHAEANDGFADRLERTSWRIERRGRRPPPPPRPTKRDPRAPPTTTRVPMCAPRPRRPDMACNCPRIDGYVLRRKGCGVHFDSPAPIGNDVIAPPHIDEELACAWADYRKDYGASGTQEHKAFRAGWLAARAGDQSAALR
jgi:hypothetical protein